jgi:hypothetical protein
MAGEDPAYVSWVRQQTCMADWTGQCRGAVQAHHAGKRGLGQRSDDDTCIPLCDGHHDAWHDGGLPFSGASKDLRRMWADLAIEVTRARHRVTSCH